MIHHDKGDLFWPSQEQLAKIEPYFPLAHDDRASLAITNRMQFGVRQVERNRSHRQNVYDLKLLIERDEINVKIKDKTLKSFLIKSRSHHIDPEKTSLESEEIKKRSAAKWGTMELEIGDLPDFEESCQQVVNFYQNLP